MAATTSTTTDTTDGAINIQVEYESSTTLPIRRRIFDQLLLENPPIKTYSIFYFLNGVRKSNDRIEYKVCKKRFNVSHIYYKDGNIIFFPVVRRHSEEVATTVPQNLSEIETVIMRYVLFEEETKLHNIRISVEYKNCEYGATHQITAEVEYEKSVFYYHESVRILEVLMFNHVGRIFAKLLPQMTTKCLYDFESPQHICNVSSRVFNLFSKGYTRNKKEVKSYKWDGYKGRMYIKEKVLYYYDDMHNVVQTVCPHLEEFENLCFQVEILNKVIIITDVLGGYKGQDVSNKNLYMPEPLDVILFFHNLRIKWQQKNTPEPFMLDLKNLGVYSVRTQFHLTKNSPSAKDLNLPHDGLIITTPNKIFKFKPPTLDVRMLNGALHIDGLASSISPQMFTTGDGTKDTYINHAIYEITPYIQNNKKTNQYEILKIRFDRTFTSTARQFKSFLSEISFFNSHVE